MSSARRKVLSFARRGLGVEHLPAELYELRARVNQLEAELWNRPHTAQGRSLVLDEGGSRARFGYDEGTASADSAYAGFEDVFRGSEDFVRDRLSYYLSWIPQHADVVDLGCGRGEMLEVLTGAGHLVTGVDLDPGMVQRCKRSGLRSVLGEAGSYLESLAGSSVDVVFSAQFIEHIDLDALTALLTASRHALRSGGTLIAETVNPHSLPALRTFWVDLTHVKPIFPETLLVLCREAGYPSAEIVFPNGSGDFERDRRHCGEYAVVAHNPQ
jgi:SAM-dependent methyltransferase